MRTVPSSNVALGIMLSGVFVASSRGSKSVFVVTVEKDCELAGNAVPKMKRANNAQCEEATIFLPKSITELGFYLLERKREVKRNGNMLHIS